MEGTTTNVEAAIISPQSNISEPFRERRATATVILEVSLIRIKEYKNSFQTLIKV